MKKITFFKVKRWHLLFLFLSISYFSSGQCINTVQFGTYESLNTGSVQPLSTCIFLNEYHTISDLIVGENYLFTLVNNDGNSKYITLTDTDNNVLAFGDSPLLVNGITASTIRMHATNSAACENQSGCHTTTIQFLADCPAPISLGANGITTTEATLFWTPIGTETAWDLQYGLTGFALGTGTSQNNLSAANFDVINLLPGTTYQFYVRAKCTSEDSIWAGPFSFTTVCLAVTDFAENFDSYQGGFNSQLPNCWEKGGNGTIYLENFGVNIPFSAPNAIYMYSSDFDGQPFISYALMPLTSNLQANTHRLRFKAYSTTGTDRFLEVGYLTNASDVSSFVSMEEISLPGTSQASAQQFILIPNNLPAGAVRLAIKNPGYPGNSTTIFIDDVFWEAIPTCIEPSDVSASNVLATTATINWDAASIPPANGYEYYFSDSSTAPTGATTPSGSVAAGITTANISNLTPVTQYFVWVRSVCAVGEYSYWTSVATFTTPCASFTPYYAQDFSTFDFNPDSLPCWNRYGQGDLTTGPTGAANSGSWTYDGWLNNGFSGAAKINIYFDFVRGWLVTPVFDLTAGGYQVKYDVGATQWGQTGPISAGGVLGSDDFVYFVMSTDGGTTWTTLETFSATNTPSNLGTTKVYNIPSTTSSSVKFAFYGTSGTVVDDADVDFFVDNFIVQTIPVTAPDCATNVQATINASCGNFATQLTWDAVSGSDGYKLTMGTTSGGNDILDNFVVNALNYSFTGAIGTTYFYKVVPFNANGDADMCVEYSFTTAPQGCYCTSAPINIDGSGMTNIVFNTYNSPIVVSGAPYYFDLSSTTVDVMQNALSNLQLTYSTGNWPYTTYVWIDLNDNYIFDSNELLFQGVAPGNGVLNASFTVPASAALGLHRMRISGGDGLGPNPCFSGSWAISVDFTVNVIEEDLSNDSFDSTNFSYYPNPVKDVFSFSYNNMISDVKVFNLLGQQVIDAKIDATQGQIDMSGLSNGAYLVKVTSDNQVKTIKIIKN